MIYLIEKNLIPEQTLYTSKFGEKKIVKSQNVPTEITRDMNIDQIKMVCKNKAIEIDLIFDFGKKGIYKAVESKNQFDEPFKIEKGLKLEKLEIELPDLKEDQVETLRPNSQFNKSETFSRIRILKDFKSKAGGLAGPGGVYYPDENKLNCKDFSKNYIFVKDNDKRLFGTVIYKADELDAHEAFISAENLEKAAHDFLINFSKIMEGHKTDALNDVFIVESYIAPTDFETFGTKVNKGDWMGVFKVLNDKIWQKIKDKEIKSVSIEGVDLG